MDIGSSGSPLESAAQQELQALLAIHDQLKGKELTKVFVRATASGITCEDKGGVLARLGRFFKGIPAFFQRKKPYDVVRNYQIIERHFAHLTKVSDALSADQKEKLQKVALDLKAILDHVAKSPKKTALHDRLQLISKKLDVIATQFAKKVPAVAASEDIPKATTSAASKIDEPPLAAEEMALEPPEGACSAEEKEFVEEFVNEFLKPYVEGTITVDTENAHRSPLIETLMPAFLEKFPGKTIAKDTLNQLAQDAYFLRSATLLVADKWLTPSLDKKVQEETKRKIIDSFYPFLKHALEIDFYPQQFTEEELTDGLNKALNTLYQRKDAGSMQASFQTLSPAEVNSQSLPELVEISLLTPTQEAVQITIGSSKTAGDLKRSIAETYHVAADDIVLMLFGPKKNQERLVPDDFPLAGLDIAKLQSPQKSYTLRWIPKPDKKHVAISQRAVHSAPQETAVSLLDTRLSLLLSKKPQMTLKELFNEIKNQCTDVEIHTLSQSTLKSYARHKARVFNEQHENRLIMHAIELKKEAFLVGKDYKPVFAVLPDSSDKLHQILAKTFEIELFKEIVEIPDLRLSNEEIHFRSRQALNDYVRARMERPLE